jgi:hypothetical protein
LNKATTEHTLVQVDRTMLTASSSLPSRTEVSPGSWAAQVRRLVAILLDTETAHSGVALGVEAGHNHRLAFDEPVEETVREALEKLTPDVSLNHRSRLSREDGPIVRGVRPPGPSTQSMSSSACRERRGDNGSRP